MKQSCKEVPFEFYPFDFIIIPDNNWWKLTGSVFLKFLNSVKIIFSCEFLPVNCEPVRTFERPLCLKDEESKHIIF